MYKYILYIYKELFFVLILNGCPEAPKKNWTLFFLNNYLLNTVVLTQNFLIFHLTEVETYFAFREEKNGITLIY